MSDQTPPHIIEAMRKQAQHIAKQGLPPDYSNPSRPGDGDPFRLLQGGRDDPWEERKRNLAFYGLTALVLFAMLVLVLTLI